MDERLTDKQVMSGFGPGPWLPRCLHQGSEELQPGVGDGGVHPLPEAFSRLRFWRGRRQGDANEADVSRNLEVRPVFDDQDPVVIARTDTCKRGRHDRSIRGVAEIGYRPKVVVAAF